MAFLEDAPGLHQTGVCRGVADKADWKQKPFEWNLPDDPRVLRHDRLLVVMVYDKDQITHDDLIGCVTIRMGEILQGPFDGWREIQRHGEPTFEWIKGLIYTNPPPPFSSKCGWRFAPSSPTNCPWSSLRWRSWTRTPPCTHRRARPRGPTATSPTTRTPCAIGQPAHWHHHGGAPL